LDVETVRHGVAAALVLLIGLPWSWAPSAIHKGMTEDEFNRAFGEYRQISRIGIRAEDGDGNVTTMRIATEPNCFGLRRGGTAVLRYRNGRDPVLLDWQPESLPLQSPHWLNEATKQLGF
jgi:hypothetical protein